MDIISYLLGKNAGGGGGGSPIIPPEAGVLESIVVGSLPDKTTYIEGEPLDLTGCVILGNFSNGYQLDVTGGCTFICNDPVTYYDTQIAVSYTSGEVTETLSIPITVTGEPVQAPSTTILLYNFDDNVEDQVSGTAMSLTPSYAAGKFGKAIAGSSSAKTVAVNWDNSKLRAENFTVEFWFKTSTNRTNISYFSVASGSPFFSSDAIATNGLRMRVSASAGSYSFANNCIGDSTPTDFSMTTWHHAAVVGTAGTYKTYLDGKLACHGNIRNDSSAKFTEFTLGDSYMVWDELLFCNEAKYLADFEPPHGPYYLAEE